MTTEKSRYQMKALDGGGYAVVYTLVTNGREVVLYQHDDKSLVAEQLRRLRNAARARDKQRAKIATVEIHTPAHHGLYRLFDKLLPKGSRPRHGED